MSRTEKPKIKNSWKKKILLIRLRRIGDILMTTPAVTALKDHFPESRLFYIVEEPYRELVEGNPYLDEVIILPAGQSRQEFLALARKIRKSRFDAVVDFHGGPRTALLTLFSGAKKKIGYRVKYKNFIYHHKISRGSPAYPVHSVENHLNLVRTLGVPFELRPPLIMPEAKGEERNKVESLIEINKLKDFNLIVFHISAGNSFRHWGEENIIHLLSMLKKHKELRVILVGSKEDQSASNFILKKSPQVAVNFTGLLNLRELRYLIQKASFFIGPDSGPMHIAATTDTPIIAYFGPTLPAHFSPWMKDAVILQKELNCRPCRQRKCIHGDFRCIRTIFPQDVYQAIMGDVPQKDTHSP
ncbi:MAG: glycosyltransferase family 9 protein [Acidobacteriota bacterium]